jgi:hypothetical protein
MIAYKFLASEARGRFSALSWPRPRDGQPGAWVEVAGELSLCKHGVHACRKAHLAHWLERELWLIELDGKMLEGRSMVAATRGRLLQPVSAWASVWDELGSYCVQRAQLFVEQTRAAKPEQLARAQAFAADVLHFCKTSSVPTAAYVSAVLAHVPSELSADDAYQAERAHQSAWLADKLGLT